MTPMPRPEFSSLSVSDVGSLPPLMNVVTGELRRLILEFELPPGTHLVESRLAERLGVSRNPVREAIRILATEGFVEVSPRRGAFVAHLSAEDAEHLFEVRLGLEPLGARLAARNGPTLGVADLAAVIEKAEAALSSVQYEGLPDLVTEFHVAVIELARNPFLNTIAIPMIKRAQWVHLPDVSQRAPHTWAEHTEMMQAIERGDEVHAENLARGHVLAARVAYRTNGPNRRMAAVTGARAAKSQSAS